MPEIRVALVGVGNSASALIQGTQYYKDAKENTTVPGLMHVNYGGYHIRDIKFVAAFEVNKDKIGKDLSEAIFTAPNVCEKFADVPRLKRQSLPGTDHGRRGKTHGKSLQHIRRKSPRHPRRSQSAERREGRSPRQLSACGKPNGHAVLRPSSHGRWMRLRKLHARIHRFKPRVGQKI